MKTTKKILALLLAVCMIAAMMAIPALAADKVSLKIEDADADSYAGYLLMTSTDDGTNYGYTVNSKYHNVMVAALGKTSMTDAEIIAAIGALDDAGVRTFADALYEEITDGSLEADETVTGNTAKDVAQGYWLFADTTVHTDEKVTSLVLLNTAGSEGLVTSAKKDLPTVEKTADKETASIGDVVTFTITGTTDNYSDSYETYFFNFYDTLTDMTYVADSIAFSFTDGNGVASTDFTATCSDGKTLTITSGDLKGKIKADTVITVTYKATLDATAAKKTTQDGVNSVYVKYSNNPYSSGLGESTPDVVNVYTYNFDLVKYTKDSSTNKLLDGATFQLLSGTDTVKFEKDTDGNYVVSKATTASADLVVTNGYVRVYGLGDGEYTLTETVVPANYNKAEDITVEIDGANLYATLDTTAKTYTEGGVAVLNSSGTELPETGGIGTTLFIVFGALAVMTAGIFLVTNQRMKKEGF